MADERLTEEALGRVQKIDRIELRLEGIEQLLRGGLSRPGIQSKLPQCPESSATKYFKPSLGMADTPSSVSIECGSETAFEGGSSMTVATIFASDFLETAVKRTSACNTSPPVKAALSSLKQMTGIQDSQTFEAQLPNRKTVPQAGVRGLEMPPLQSVLSILREMKDITPITLSVTCLFISKERLVECCRSVYFPLDNFSLPTFLIANATLRYLFQEKALAEADPASAEEYQNFYHLCRANLETTLANLNFLLYPNAENIESLLLGGIYAIEASKPLLAWQLIWGAAGMCQTLGWHQLVSNGNCAAERKTSLFWFAYLLDRGLSLRLGRASAIQDHEITLPRRLDRRGMLPGWQALLEQWIRHSEIVGKVYQDLYSPSALRMPAQERGERATHLAAALKRIMDDSLMPLGQAQSVEIMPEHFGLAASNLVAMVLKADEVWYWTTLTMIHRAASPKENGNQTFSVVCLESARMAFEAHRECMRISELSSNMKAAYLLWYQAQTLPLTIIYTPFIPFIVIFCNVIETSNSDDICTLGEFCESLKPVCPTLEAVNKLHNLCLVLYNVAVTYVESKAQNPGCQGMHVENEVSAHFKFPRGPLAFDSSCNHPSAVAVDVLTSQAEGHASQLREWISGNTHMMEISEEDLSEFLAQLT
ncbi:hypothetical protein S40285_03667 [Stachybotrys chlorohalonatus IBT 40285]|uniref:Xylanolytic transcriptional activator regulatory domain-containing protein n=1 Tax=Stachybotrys chlorohalonatus (strain IBT 40285) TaxID=1283841 RepID=A0A084QTL7_STAC4|nr:hypothetical protein S40285_03667 [Stachybotrys chlorohalonata IBT 40285]